MVTIPIPASAPATATGTDGVTSTVIGTNETLTPAVPADPEVPTQDFIMNGDFRGEVSSARGVSSSNHMEAGYQLRCRAGQGMLGSLVAPKPSFETIKVIDESFTDDAHAMSIRDYRVRVDCPGSAFIRSYAILTRNAGAATSVVAYYGNEVPAAAPDHQAQ